LRLAPVQPGIASSTAVSDTNAFPNTQPSTGFTAASVGAGADVGAGSAVRHESPIWTDAGDDTDRDHDLDHRDPDRRVARVQAGRTANASRTSALGHAGRWPRGRGRRRRARYATFGFNDTANLDDGTMWPTAFALTRLTAGDEKMIAELVRKAAG
jgi:hypothetical protein